MQHYTFERPRATQCLIYKESFIALTYIDITSHRGQRAHFPYVLHLDSGEVHLCEEKVDRARDTCVATAGFTQYTWDGQTYQALRDGSCSDGTLYGVYVFTKHGKEPRVCLQTPYLSHSYTEIYQTPSNVLRASVTKFPKPKPLVGFKRRTVVDKTQLQDDGLCLNMCRRCSDGVVRVFLWDKAYTRLKMITIRPDRDSDVWCDIGPPGYVKVRDFDVSPDGRFLLIAASAPPWSLCPGARYVQLYRIASDTEVYSHTTYEMYSSLVAFSPDGLTFAVGIAAKHTPTPSELAGITIMDVDV